MGYPSGVQDWAASQSSWIITSSRVAFQMQWHPGKC